MHGRRSGILWGIVGAGIMVGAAGCSERRVSTAYYVEINSVPQPTNRVFQAGDAYKLVLRNGAPAFVYLLRQEPSGSYRVLFPSLAIGGGSPWLGVNATVMLPIDGSYRFPEENGAVELVMLVSTHRTEDLAILEVQPQLDAAVAEDIIRVFEAHPGTVRWPEPAPSDVRVSREAIPAASGNDYRGNVVVVRSPSPEIGAVARFSLRYELR
jgi:hypothetical protein